MKRVLIVLIALALVCAAGIGGAEGAADGFALSDSPVSRALGAGQRVEFTLKARADMLIDAVMNSSSDDFGEVFAVLFKRALNRYALSLSLERAEAGDCARLSIDEYGDILASVVLQSQGERAYLGGTILNGDVYSFDSDELFSLAYAALVAIGGSMDERTAAESIADGLDGLFAGGAAGADIPGMLSGAFQGTLERVSKGVEPVNEAWNAQALADVPGARVRREYALSGADARALFEGAIGELSALLTSVPGAQALTPMLETVLTYSRAVVVGDARLILYNDAHDGFVRAEAGLLVTLDGDARDVSITAARYADGRNPHLTILFGDDKITLTIESEGFESAEATPGADWMAGLDGKYGDGQTVSGGAGAQTPSADDWMKSIGDKYSDPGANAQGAQGAQGAGDWMADIIGKYGGVAPASSAQAALFERRVFEINAEYIPAAGDKLALKVYYSIDPGEYLDGYFSISGYRGSLRYAMLELTMSSDDGSDMLATDNAIPFANLGTREALARLLENGLEAAIEELIEGIKPRNSFFF